MKSIMHGAVKRESRKVSVVKEADYEVRRIKL